MNSRINGIGTPSAQSKIIGRTLADRVHATFAINKCLIDDLIFFIIKRLMNDYEHKNSQAIHSNHITSAALNPPE